MGCRIINCRFRKANQSRLLSYRQTTAPPGLLKGISRLLITDIDATAKNNLEVGEKECDGKGHR
jgi:hypothetical protein